MVTEAPMPPENGAIFAAPVSQFCLINNPARASATVDQTFPLRNQTARESEASVIRHLNQHESIITPDAIAVEDTSCPGTPATPVDNDHSVSNGIPACNKRRAGRRHMLPVTAGTVTTCYAALFKSIRQ